MTKRLFFPLFLLLSFSVFLIGCFGTDANEGDVEKGDTSELCTDGEDNDADGMYDCYDSDCRKMDSILVSRGEVGWCKDDDIPVFNYASQNSSSSEDGSAGSESSDDQQKPSSDSKDAADEYPKVFDGTDELAAIQLKAMAYDSEDDIVAIGGKTSSGQGVYFARFYGESGDMLGTVTMQGTRPNGDISNIIYGESGYFEDYFVAGGTINRDDTNLPHAYHYRFKSDGAVDLDVVNVKAASLNTTEMSMGPIAVDEEGTFHIAPNGNTPATDAKTGLPAGDVGSTLWQATPVDPQDDESNFGYAAIADTRMPASIGTYTDMVPAKNKGVFAVGNVSATINSEIRITRTSGTGAAVNLTTLAITPGSTADDERAWSVIQELKKLYRATLQQNPNEESKGAGLGIIDIARKSGKPIHYDIQTIDEKHSFFSLKAEIELLNQEAA